MKPLFETRTYETESAKNGVIFSTNVAGRTGRNPIWNRTETYWTWNKHKPKPKLKHNEFIQEIRRQC